MGLGIFAISGGCFREKRYTNILVPEQNVRVGTPAGIQGQRLATNSHLQLAEFVEKHYNFQILFFLSTYKENSTLLKSWYGQKLLHLQTTSKDIGYVNLFKKVRKAILSSTLSGSFKFIFHFRCDVVFKELFAEIFNPHWDRVTLAHKECAIRRQKRGLRGGCNDILPSTPRRINDVMIFLPDHCSNCCYILNPHWGDVGLLGAHSIQFMLSLPHDTNTMRDSNPLYFLAGRPRSNVSHANI